MNKDKGHFRKYDGLKYGWIKDAEKFLLIFAAVFCVFRFLIGITLVKGDSMEPTLHGGELVVYTRIHSEYEAGDVVSVRIPSGEYYVKRIIATAGDTVEVKDGGVYVNGVFLEEPYVQGITKEQEGIVRYPVTLEKGQVFIMGDNREVSMDSRSFGVVGERQIKGKLILHAGQFYIKKVS